MPRVVRGALIQATLCEPATSPVAKIKEAMLEKHVALIAQAAGRGAQVVCLQELFTGPYFCAEQQSRWYDLTERVPDGPTTKLMPGPPVVCTTSTLACAPVISQPRTET